MLNKLYNLVIDNIHYLLYYQILVNVEVESFSEDFMVSSSCIKLYLKNNIVIINDDGNYSINGVVTDKIESLYNKLNKKISSTKKDANLYLIDKGNRVKLPINKISIIKNIDSIYLRYKNYNYPINCFFNELLSFYSFLVSERNFLVNDYNLKMSNLSVLVDNEKNITKMAENIFIRNVITDVIKTLDSDFKFNSFEDYLFEKFNESLYQSPQDIDYQVVHELKVMNDLYYKFKEANH